MFLSSCHHARHHSGMPQRHCEPAGHGDGSSAICCVRGAGALVLSLGSCWPQRFLLLRVTQVRGLPGSVRVRSSCTRGRRGQPHLPVGAARLGSKPLQSRRPGGWRDLFLVLFGVVAFFFNLDLPGDLLLNPAHRCVLVPPLQRANETASSVQRPGPRAGGHPAGALAEPACFQRRRPWKS